MILYNQDLVDLYRTFYRAGENRTSFRRKTIQPLHEACEVICGADAATLRDPGALQQAIASRLSRWGILPHEAEENAISRFSQYLAAQVFFGKFDGNLERFVKKRGLLEDACDLRYRLTQAKEEG